jgi:uncharacterized membrane protein YcgQ (UPF0703/DUF1980 family)
MFAFALNLVCCVANIVVVGVTVALTNHFPIGSAMFAVFTGVCAYLSRP